MKDLLAKTPLNGLIDEGKLTLIGRFVAELYAFLPRLVAAIILLVVGWKLISFLSKRFNRFLEKSDYDQALRSFVSSLSSITLQIALLISVASMVGIKTTSFLALLGSAGLAVGLAMQGSLSNFAGGVMLLIFKPFDVGDYVEAQGFQGTVKKLAIFHTTLNTIDNKQIILPNGPLANSPITNFSAEDVRRVDFLFGISYSDDVLKAKNLLYEVLRADSRVLTEPEPMVALHQLGDSSVNLTARAWTKTEDYWPFYWETMEKVKLTFDEKGITIPFPQRDVHLQQAQS